MSMSIYVHLTQRFPSQPYSIPRVSQTITTPFENGNIIYEWGYVTYV